MKPYDAPMNVNATGPPTVMWKCPTIHIVLWTSIINGALTSSSIPQAFAVFVILACLSLALFIHSMREAVA